jgi:hypothetical protein
LSHEKFITCKKKKKRKKNLLLVKCAQTILNKFVNYEKRNPKSFVGFQTLWTELTAQAQPPCNSPGPTSVYDPSTYASPVAGVQITGKDHHAFFVASLGFELRDTLLGRHSYSLSHFRTGDGTAAFPWWL